MTASKISRGGRRSTARRCARSPTPTLSAPCEATAATRSGPCGVCRTRNPCRSLPPPTRANSPRKQDPLLPSMSLGEHVAADYQTLRLSLKAHPMAVLRPIFTRERIMTCAEVSALTDGAFARARRASCWCASGPEGQRHFRHARRRNRHPQYRHLGAALRALPPRDDGVTTHAGGRKGAEEPRKCRASDGAAHYRPQPRAQ